jgi:cytochrome c oxidase subunit I+III
VQWIPGPTYVPLLAALATTAAAAGVLSRAYLLAALACAATAVAVIAWLTPKRKVLAMLRETPLEDLTDLPVLTRGPAATVWWGMLSVVTILGTSLAALIYSYFYLRLFSSEWPQGEIGLPGLWLPLAAYAALAAAGGVQYFAMRQFLRHRWLGAQLGLAAVFVMGLAFLALQAWELLNLDFAPQTNAYGSMFYILNWFVTLVVAVGLAIQVGVQFRLPKEHHDRDGFMGLQMELALIFWLFVAAAGVLVFATLYLSPRWL